MEKDTDTKVLQRDDMLRLARKPRPSVSPFLVAALVVAFIVIAFVGVLVVKRAHRMKPTGTIEATYVANAKARDFLEVFNTDEPVPPVPQPTLNHVIFRLGDAEIFRFTYEDGGDGLHYSFEVVEGSR